MIELEIDGQKVEVPQGSMVMDAATKLGLYVPHFCYHKKLSIAANCRMCLVEVEKAPKPMPACATPAAAGMKVFTQSEKAKNAQKSVMEFLLINHPLDCPICDQGGECQLQDLAVGYGPSASRYSEEKRVVFHKPMGPLISAEEMSRCIHCTRCVRFGQEIAGVMELGMAGRGEHSEIMSFVGSAVESELSGNMIDICPVGALTSKPFRYSARTWELSRKRSVSPHDSVGANIVVQSKNNRVLRVVPLENEAVNECWISDRDRFSYEGLNSDHRLTLPMIKDSMGHWHEASWEEALSVAAAALKTAPDLGPNQLRTLVSPNSTLEEFGLAAMLTRGCKSDSIDHRLRLSDSAIDQCVMGIPTLGMPIAEVSHLDRALLIGSFLRAEQPLLAQRLRQAVRHGAQVASLHASALDLLMPVAHQLIASPAVWEEKIAELVVAVCAEKNIAAPAAYAQRRPGSQAVSIAKMLLSSQNAAQQCAIFLGDSVLAHPQASQLIAAAHALAQTLGCRFGFVAQGANSVAANLAKAKPIADGENTAQMFARPSQAALLINVDPSMDCGNSAKVRSSLKHTKKVVALSAFKDGVMEVAHVVLPITPFTETSGTYINCEGRVQFTQAVVKPLGQARPAWKVLRVLGNLLGLEGFDFESSEDVRRVLIGEAADASLLRIDSITVGLLPSDQAASNHDNSNVFASSKSGLIRLADIPIYRSDAVVRHADSLQQTRASAVPKARINPADLQRLGLASGSKMKFMQEGAAAEVLELVADASVAQGVALISAACAATKNLGAMIGPLELEQA
jgi:NADH-quinone oxidoreductase subunit G